MHSLLTRQIPHGADLVQPAAVLLIAGPSGAGKTTIAEAMLSRIPSLRRVVTTTSRPPRPGEINGVHYHFTGVDANGVYDEERAETEFLALKQAGAFLEDADVHPKPGARFKTRYGSTRSAIDDVHAAGGHPCMILDVQGVASARALLPVITLFVTAPREELICRISGDRPAAQVEARIASMDRELAEMPTYDWVLSNPDGKLEATLAAAEWLYHDSVAPQLTAYREQVAKAARPAVRGVTR